MTPAENGRALDVHHIDPFRFSGDNRLENLRALCRSCHMRADDHGRAGSATFLRRAGRSSKPTKREIRRLWALARQAERTARRRAHQTEARRVHAAGASLRQIARALGISHQTVANWIDGRYRTEHT
jgi:DNA invertase Pin-like site-specific DNA recombinase